MKRLAITTLLGLAAVVAFALSGPPETVQASGVEWITDYKAGITKAREENKPIFLEFRCVP
ncbi:MAG: hypothetical protein KDB32_00045 [Planctomycetes bacterium]|nr:hypothetical protein [Planctomycetota bacterium]MCA8945891.1 hypothetical protein [Planctomycetota bacterium]